MSVILIENNKTQGNLMRTAIMSFVCSVLFAGVIVQAEEPAAQVTPPVIAKATPRSDNENVATATTNNWNFDQKYSEWKALLNGKNGMPKDKAKADQILTRLIKGVYLVKFGPADGFNPQTPGEYISVFFQTSSLRSGTDGRLSIGFLRTKRENNKLTASFLTDRPDQMKNDIEKNHQLVFISMEEMTPEKFIAYDKSVQESLQNKSSGQFYSPLSTPGRYMTCENHAGAGFYWVDTTSGKVWWTDMSAKEKIEWQYLGQPQGAKAGDVGTYVPQANKSGGGLFILNPITGEGWWTNGKEWESIGKPTDAITAEDTATPQKIINVTAGVKFFRDGDSITISEVKATSPDLTTGAKVIVKGRYTLSSRPKASLSLYATDAKGPDKGEFHPEQQISVSAGQGDFELCTTLEYDGYLHVTFYSVPEGKPFGGLYFGTVKQMKDIKNWDIQNWYTAE